jgi:hypothetical protein
MKKALISLSALLAVQTVMANGVFEPTNTLVLKPTRIDQCSDEHNCIYTSKKHYVFSVFAFDDKSKKAINNAVKKKSCVKIVPKNQKNKWGDKLYSATSVKCSTK